MLNMKVLDTSLTRRIRQMSIKTVGLPDAVSDENGESYRYYRCYSRTEDNINMCYSRTVNDVDIQVL